VTYPAAVVAATRRPALALAFVEFLRGEQARAALSRLGFESPAAAR
jgi:ABC-type molybdate transport system substrate-binding protein